MKTYRTLQGVWKTTPEICGKQEKISARSARQRFSQEEGAEVQCAPGWVRRSYSRLDFSGARTHSV